MPFRRRQQISSLASALAAGLMLLSWAVPSSAQTPEQTAVITGKSLTIAAVPARPFVMKADDGSWQGLSIELWSSVADGLGLSYEFRETSLQGLLDGVASGEYDAGVGAITITPSREERLDFTHPFYTTGFAIAVPEAEAGMFAMLTRLWSWEFLQAIVLLACLLGIVGLLFWLTERKRNPEQFGGRPWSGIGSGFWFSAVTMTTVGYGDKAPLTLPGRIVALVWMFTAVIIISTFTGMIASSLTAERLAGVVRGPEDLPSVRVGSIAGSASDERLTADRVTFRSFENVSAGFDAIVAGRIDAFVYDAPLLRYLAKSEYEGKVMVLPATFGRQDYGFALPAGSALRETFNRRLLEYVESNVWQAGLYRYLGKGE